MGKNLLVGVGSKARKVKALYVGVGGKARKVKKVYVGVGGKARLVYQSYIPVTGISASVVVAGTTTYLRERGIVTISVSPDNATNKAITFALFNKSNFNITETAPNGCTLECTYGTLNIFSCTLRVQAVDMYTDYTVTCNKGNWSITRA